MEKRNYIDKANQLSKAIDIAIDAFKKHSPKDWPYSQIQHFITTYTSFKEGILEPEPQFKNLGSLKYVEHDAFIFFQEGSGEAVNYFWEQIKAFGLPYKRQNAMLKILKRQRINNQIEYDFVTDVIVPYEQEGLITQHDVNILSSLLLAFESKGKTQVKGSDRSGTELL